MLSIALIASLCIFPVSAEEPFALTLNVTPETVSDTNAIASAGAARASTARIFRPPKSVAAPPGVMFQTAA